jgi:hypothetical protein
MKKLLIIFIVISLAACQGNKQKNDTGSEASEIAELIPSLDLNQANRLANLPIECVNREYPNKLNQTINSDDDLNPPRELHPAFYGCFDWHSSVHGHWSLVKLLKNFPELEKAGLVRELLSERITKENIEAEIKYFKQEKNKTFERTYGWAWLLKLAEELKTWDDPLARELEENLDPLAGLIAEKYVEFLPRLNYPIRVGTHTNTAFGLTFAFDYAMQTDNSELLTIITERARDFYLYDTECPVSWEPGGNDFLSPCLEEANIMMRVLDQEEFKIWLRAFLPDLSDKDYYLEPGIVTDRSDGQLAHLDGLNFSRAWCLYGIASYIPEYKHLKPIADRHIMHSLPDITSGHYEGSHWLASFALLALDSRID